MSFCAIVAAFGLGCTDKSGHTANQNSENNDCGCTAEYEVCYDNTCYDQRTCANPCPEGEICMDGACMLCISGGQCFSTGNESVHSVTGCDTKDDCNPDYDCVAGECKKFSVTSCDSGCADDQVCYQDECRPKSLLWSLCRASSECGNNSNCIFEVQPSTVMQYKGKTYGTSDNLNIPVSLIDSRISVENYNETHPNSKVGEEQRIGICSVQCTLSENNCSSGWTCMLALTGDSVYPADAELPFAKQLDKLSLEKSGYANLCRPLITENTAKYYPFNASLCSADEKACKDAGGVFYDGMCLESCKTGEKDSCPLMFSCQNVNSDGESKSLCVPNTGTCGACLDRDRDGRGYGLCLEPGIDCDDDNDKVWYGKPLENDKASCSIYQDKVTDFNCNGQIDRFEVIGTVENCSACGEDCPSPSAGGKSVVECIQADGDPLDEDWRDNATTATKTESFVCRTGCEFGYGDCGRDAKCNTRLLSETARIADEEGNVTITLDPSYFHISSNTGKVLVRDADEDGYAALDNAASAEQGHVVLSSRDTLICCAKEPDVCYTADASWDTTSSLDGYLDFTKTTDLVDVMRYDANDNDPQIHPEAGEICDGIDNDGSTVLFKPGKSYVSCALYCMDHIDECKVFKNADGTYKINSVCDAAPDGLDDPYKLIDPVTSESYTGGGLCILRNPSNEICNSRAVVICSQMDGSWRLKCESPEGNGTADGLENGLPHFDGRDDDCDGKVDEDAWVPCVITNSALPWSMIKDGVSDTRDYKVYQTASGYELPKNTDGSLNLCRIGILQPTPELTPMCKPLYEPREFDYYGDGVDSNCDGADYDMVHARFIAKSGQGDGQASNDDGRTCKYGTDNRVLPCSTFNHAIEQAKDGNGFYQDILVENNTFQIKMKYKDSSHPYPSPITLPNYENIGESPRFVRIAVDASVNTTYIHNGHIISAYGLHQYLTYQKQNLTDFNANDYLFSYETETENIATHAKEYSIAAGSEKNRPDEVIRIYGGFTRQTATSCTMPTGCDYWKKTGTSTVKWSVTPESNTSVYSMISASQTGTLSPLSLLLANLNLEMAADSDVVPDYQFANGITFVGINSSQKSQILTLDNTTISVKGINGYSFDTDNSRNKNTNKGLKGGESREVLDPYRYFENYVYACSPSEKGRGLDCHSLTKRYADDYANNFWFAFLQMDGCGYGRTPNSATQSVGGMGGYAKIAMGTSICTKDTCKGKPGIEPSYKEGWNYYLMEEYNKLVGQPQNYLLTNSNMNGISGCGTTKKEQWGRPGKGGKPGTNGKKDDIIMSFAINANDGLYVSSDRSMGQGMYGLPGAGGSGGNVGYVFPGTMDLDDGKYVRAGSGGPGGCGGQGGEAGGTGGSAFGIILSSAPDNANSAVLNIQNMRSPVVTVTNGKGGRAQIGADGGKGYGAVDQWSYHSDYISHYSAGGGGAGGGGGNGGLGAGGRPGWAYPYILLCHSDKNITDFDAANLSNVSACKFSISQDMALFAGSHGYGEQNMTGTGYKDTPTDLSLGKGDDGTPVQDECVRNKCESYEVWDYGGAGGSVAASKITELQSDSNTWVDDISCSIGEAHDPVIVKPLVYNKTDGTIK